MQVRIFTLRFNPVTDSFDDRAVAAFLADKNGLSIRDYFFVPDGVPYLTLVVRYRATDPRLRRMAPMVIANLPR